VLRLTAFYCVFLGIANAGTAAAQGRVLVGVSRRFDVRYTRFFDTRKGRVALYADVFNLLNRRNPRGYEYSLFFNPSFTVRRDYDVLLPRLPSLGLS
jgi:hypothetical protein